MTDALTQLQEIKKTVAEWQLAYHARGFAAARGLDSDEYRYFSTMFDRAEDKLMDLLEQTPPADNIEAMKRKIKEYRL